MFAGCDPQDLLAPTLADVWQLTTSGRAIVLAQGSIDRAATPLAGLTLTLVMYAAGWWSYTRCGMHPLANPVLILAVVMPRESGAPSNPRR